jgi:DUF1009 family protein
LRGFAEAELAGHVDQFHWCGVTHLGRMIRLFRREGVRRLVMAGKVWKGAIMHAPWRLWTFFPDWRMVRLWYSRRADNRDDTILLRFIEEFAKDGLCFESALDLCPELLVPHGLLTRRPLNAQEERDVAFGWNLAREMGRLDVGQSVCVKERSVLAVEAIEGTDKAILRAGELCPRGGFAVVKVAKPKQDLRFDVPTVGCLTIEAMHRAGGRVLAIEAGMTIVLDRAETIALANRHGISLIAIDAAKSLGRAAG